MTHAPTALRELDGLLATCAGPDATAGARDGPAARYADAAAAAVLMAPARARPTGRERLTAGRLQTQGDARTAYKADDAADPALPEPTRGVGGSTLPWLQDRPHVVRRHAPDPRDARGGDLHVCSAYMHVCIARAGKRLLSSGSGIRTAMVSCRKGSSATRCVRSAMTHRAPSSTTALRSSMRTAAGR